MKIPLRILFKACTFIFTLGLCTTPFAQTNAWINEIHYDNSGGDVGEAIEIVIENPDMDLSKYRIDLYNGNGGTSYDSEVISNITVGDVEGSFHIFTWVKSGIQNGAPDGIALSYNGSLIQFLSYEGSFEAVGGPADGVMSTDIGVSEGSTPIGSSLQLSGVGIMYAAFTWQPAATDTFGSLNNNQNFYNYIYSNNSWSPNDPSDIMNPSTATSSLLVKNGIAPIAGNVNALNISINDAATINFGGDVNLFGKLDPNAGTININTGTLNFKSNATGTAVIGDTSNATLNGTVTVERYIPESNRAFRLLTAPVTNAQTIREAWQEGVNNPDTNTNLNPNSGFGTHITGGSTITNTATAAEADALGFDVTATNNPSMFTVNEQALPEAEYVAIQNTNNTNLDAGTGYLVLVRGDRSIDLSTNTPAPTATTLSASGELLLGDYVVPAAQLNPGTDRLTTGNGSSLVGNPYQSVIDMFAVLNDPSANDIATRYFHIYDPTRNTRGGFITIFSLVISDPSFDRKNSTDIDNPSNSDPANEAPNAQATRYVQPGQAVFINTDEPEGLSTTSNPMLTFKQSHKNLAVANNSDDGVFRPSNQAKSGIHMKLYESSQIAIENNWLDAFTISFGENFSNDINDFDAPKPLNLDENIGSRNDEKNFSIQHRLTPNSQEEIQLFTNNYRHSDYTLKISISELDNVSAFLVDNYLQTETELQNNAQTLVQFNVDEDIVESTASDRFKVIFKERVLANETFNKARFTVYPNPATTTLVIQTSNSNFSKGSITVFNMLGQSVLTSKLTASKQSIDVSGINSGVYLVKIDAGETTVTKRIVIQ